MSTVVHSPGTFCWVDLAASDHGASEVFYAALFRWTAQDIPTPYNAYTMMLKDGNTACALYPMGGKLRSRGIRSCWRS
jgi:predicted enzyme related to lactoylglutathione lyase